MWEDQVDWPDLTYYQHLKVTFLVEGVEGGEWGKKSSIAVWLADARKSTLKTRALCKRWKDSNKKAYSNLEICGTGRFMQGRQIADIHNSDKILAIGSNMQWNSSFLKTTELWPQNHIQSVFITYGTRAKKVKPCTQPQAIKWKTKHPIPFNTTTEEIILYLLRNEVHLCGHHTVNIMKFKKSVQILTTFLRNGLILNDIELNYMRKKKSICNVSKFSILFPVWK